MRLLLASERALTSYFRVWEIRETTISSQSNKTECRHSSRPVALFKLHRNHPSGFLAAVTVHNVVALSKTPVTVTKRSSDQKERNATQMTQLTVTLLISLAPPYSHCLRVLLALAKCKSMPKSRVMQNASLQLLLISKSCLEGI